MNVVFIKTIEYYLHVPGFVPRNFHCVDTLDWWVVGTEIHGISINCVYFDVPLSYVICCSSYWNFWRRDCCSWTSDESQKHLMKSSSVHPVCSFIRLYTTVSNSELTKNFNDCKSIQLLMLGTEINAFDSFLFEHSSSQHISGEGDSPNGSLIN